MIPNSTNTTGGTASFIAWGVIAAFFVAWLAVIAWREREKPLWVRSVPLMAIVASLLVLWALVRYGDALLHWIKR